MPRTIDVVFSRFAGGDDLCPQGDGSKTIASVRFVSGPTKIFINERILNYLGPAQPSIVLPCAERGVLHLLRSALVHEVAHIYDRQARFANSEEIERFMCAEQTLGAERIRLDEMSPRCRYLTRLQEIVSGRRSYEKVSLAQKNHLSSRTGDRYELKNLAESFAVNLELFLLDPEFKCRRPAMYQHLARTFAETPFPEFRCSSVDFVISGLDGSRIVINPERIYQIHYLQAHAGKRLLSRWGHAMLRLVVCAKFRQAVGSECLQDLSSHIVISFRANVPDFAINSFKGLTGKYSSQMYSLPMWKVLTEYTIDEGRSLTSYPLRFSQDERRRFLSRMMESFWSYRGKYFFTANNCASETYDLILSAFADDHRLYDETMPMVPDGIRKRLTDAGAIMELPASRAEQTRLGYFFPSTHSEDVAAAFAHIRGVLGTAVPDEPHEYFADLTAVERRTHIGHAVATNKSARLTANLYLLEVEAERHIRKKIGEQLARETQRKESEAHLLERYRQLSDAKHPLNHTRRGYGIPLDGEFDVDGFQRALRAFKSEFSDLTNVVAPFSPELAAEMRATEANVRYLLDAQFQAAASTIR